jgi:hypothetical protein
VANLEADRLVKRTDPKSPQEVRVAHPPGGVVLIFLDPYSLPIHDAPSRFPFFKIIPSRSGFQASKGVASLPSYGSLCPSIRCDSSPLGLASIGLWSDTHHRQNRLGKPVSAPRRAEEATLEAVRLVKRIVPKSPQEERVAHPPGGVVLIFFNPYCLLIHDAPSHFPFFKIIPSRSGFQASKGVAGLSSYGTLCPTIRCHSSPLLNIQFCSPPSRIHFSLCQGGANGVAMALREGSCCG